MDKYALSIIIPAYNAEKYIVKCIESFINQINDSIEVLLIDDGSTDSTSRICDKYAKSNKNIKVYHVANGGQAKARNIGIKEASGHYIMFIDSDDYLADKNIISKIIKATKENPDVIVYGYKKYWEGTQKYTEKSLLDQHVAEKKDNILEYLVKTNYFKGCPWDKVIKTSVIRENNMFFPEGRLSEDIDWCAQLIKSIDNESIFIINENPYVYVQHEGSTSKKIKLKHIQDILYIFEKNIYKENDDILKEYFAFEYCMSLGIINSNYCEMVPQSIKKSFYSYGWILKYNKCKKVKLCYILSKILGIRLCSIILGKYINLKKRNV